MYVKCYWILLPVVWEGKHLGQLSHWKPSKCLGKISNLKSIYEIDPIVIMQARENAGLNKKNDRGIDMNS